VDSAVAALLVARDGGEALGVTLELWAEGGNAGAASCCSAEAVRSARRLAHELGMPHFSIDLRTEFKAGVVERWLAEQASGLTPNPCVRCNGSVRLDAMLEIAERLGARSLATGHYARIRGGAVLATGADAAKDQSYTLCAVSADSLSRLRFPLGELSKQEVRRIAAEAGLAVASKRDSQDLCFLAGTRSAAFLERHLGVGGLAGPIIDESGSRVGEHAGAHAYTVGQRRGLGIGGPEPLFVLATDTHANTVTVGPRSRLLSDRLGLRDVSLRLDGAGVDGVRMRAHGRTLGCRLAGSPAPGTHESLEVALAEAAERTAPGQVACLYAGELVAGYGTITAPQRSRT
jgi:tRNA-specific 2-thiouridylase